MPTHDATFEAGGESQATCSPCRLTVCRVRLNSSHTQSDKEGVHNGRRLELSLDQGGSRRRRSRHCFGVLRGCAAVIGAPVDNQELGQHPGDLWERLSDLE